MVKYIGEPLDGVFSALADPTRRGILAALSDGGKPVSELAQPFAMSLPGFMKHLGILEESGLIEREKEGRVVNCRLTATPLREAMDWLERYAKFWDERLDALARYLETSNGGTGPLPRRTRGALPAPPPEKSSWTQSPKNPRSRSCASSRPPRRKSGARSRSRKR